MKSDYKLSTGRKVEIKEMSVDEVDECNDVSYIVNDGPNQIIKNLSKARTAWIRKGLKGGDFKKFKLDDGVVSDSVLKQMTEAEKSELAVIIQGAQLMGE
tara:strand:- start:110 stop:409 length:300 start_codon:yes stop_codon:yes gene_type:complete